MEICISLRVEAVKTIPHQRFVATLTDTDSCKVALNFIEW